MKNLLLVLSCLCVWGWCWLLVVLMFLLIVVFLFVFIVCLVVWLDWYCIDLGNFGGILLEWLKGGCLFFGVFLVVLGVVESFFGVVDWCCCFVGGVDVIGGNVL